MPIERNASYLVIGSDGSIGRQIFTQLKRSGEPVWGTSRRPRSTDSRIIHLDLEEPFQEACLPEHIDVAVFCTGSDIQACEADPALTRRVNVTNTLRVAEKLLGQDTFVLYVSSNAVFDGTKRYPVEDAPTTPATEYGRQKAEVEGRLLEIDRGRGFLAVCRMTKIVTPTVPAIQRFLEGLTQGKPVEALSDLRLSPSSLEYAVSSLVTVARKRVSGVLHFSGEGELSYAEFACALANQLDVSDTLVKAVTVRDHGATPLFCPVHPALGMARTQEKLGISPQPLHAVVAELLVATGALPVA